MVEIRSINITEELVLAKAKKDNEYLRDEHFRGEGNVIDIVGRNNQVWLGQPQVYFLRELFKKTKEKISPELMIEMENSDLLVVQFACSFRPSDPSQFVKASVKAYLDCGNSSDISPIAYDLFPKEVVLPINYSRTFSVKPDVKLDFNKLFQAEISAIQSDNKTEYIRYEPEITAFGKGGNSPGWDFNKSVSRSIRGVKDLFVLVKKPRFLPLNVRFEIMASVKTYLGIFPLPIFLNDSNDTPLIEERFVLTKN